MTDYTEEEHAAVSRIAAGIRAYDETADFDALGALIVAEIRRAREVLRQACINAAMVEADVMEEADMTCGCRIANHIRSVIGDIRKLP